MSKLTKKEKLVLRTLCKDFKPRPSHIRKSAMVLDGERIMHLYYNRDCFISEYPVGERLFSKLTLGKEYSISELLGEEE